MTSDFIFEIGTEELPHRFIGPAKDEISSKIEALLNANHLNHSSYHVFITPRRIAVLINGLSLQQNDEVIEKKGPPLKAAFKGGVLTPAGSGFLSNTPYVSICETELTDFANASNPPADGVYKKLFGDQHFLYLTTFKKGEKTKTILEKELPLLIQNFQFPKKMRWASYDFTFARPIRWILALLGDEVIPFSLAGIETGNFTYGHPQLFPRYDKIVISDPTQYLSQLRDKKVFADPEERKEEIRKQLTQIENQHGYIIPRKEDVLGMVTNLVEYPHLVLCEFDIDFLRVPPEVLISEMVEHQMYFPVSNKEGVLLNKFIVTSNIEREDFVRKGNLKVLTARLRDGSFLYDSDLKKGIAAMGEKLGEILYQKELGTMAQKVERIKNVAEALIQSTALPVDTNKVLQICSLMKNDLVSSMVYEFPELQGVMGAYYAKAAGFTQAESSAIAEQYMPLASGSKLPETEVGLILSLADKFDNIAGCFAAGLIPTGSGDPYALRRQAQGIVRILIEKKIDLDLPRFLSFIAPFYEEVRKSVSRFETSAMFQASILDFFKNRIKTIFKTYNFSPDEIDAACESQFSNILALYEVIDAVHEKKGESQWLEFITIIKRLENILKEFGGGDVDPTLFAITEERALYEMVLQKSAALQSYKDSRNYKQFFAEFATFSSALSQFFEKVLVECEQENLKRNRKAILFKIISTTRGLLDFMKIVT